MPRAVGRDAPPVEVEDAPDAPAPELEPRELEAEPRELEPEPPVEDEPADPVREELPVTRAEPLAIAEPLTMTLPFPRVVPLIIVVPFIATVAGIVPLTKAVPFWPITTGAVWLATVVPLLATMIGASVMTAAAEAAEVALAMAELAAAGFWAAPTTYDWTSEGRAAIHEGVELAASSAPREEKTPAELVKNSGMSELGTAVARTW
jgi:hypothetical protein